MRVSEQIVRHILEQLERSDSGSAIFQRAELAGLVGCVPSQINYVLSNRFTPEQGYAVESRRGGGGYIRITRVQMSRSALLMHTVNAVGHTLDAMSARLLVEELLHQGIVSVESARLLLAAAADSCYRDITHVQRDCVRAALIKNMLIQSTNGGN